MKNMASTLSGVGACCTPDLPERGAVAKFRKARFAPLRGGLRPGLTEFGDSALKISGWEQRNGIQPNQETAPGNGPGPGGRSRVRWFPANLATSNSEDPMMFFLNVAVHIR